MQIVSSNLVPTKDCRGAFDVESRRLPNYLAKFSMIQPAHESFPRRPTATADDLALVAVMMQRLRAGADLRRAKVRRIRSAIHACEYENALKLDIAAERVVDDVRIGRLERAPGELDALEE